MATLENKKFVTFNGKKYRVTKDMQISADLVQESNITFDEGQLSSAKAVTATSDGLTTGIIPTGATYVNVTSGNAAHIVLLPPPTIGTVVWIFVGTNGCELRAGTAAGADGSDTISIGGNTASANHESALPANSLSLLVCTSATTWVGLEIASNNAVSAVEVAAS